MQVSRLNSIPPIVYAFALLLILLALWQWDRQTANGGMAAADWLPEEIDTLIGVIVAILLKLGDRKEDK